MGETQTAAINKRPQNNEEGIQTPLIHGGLSFFLSAVPDQCAHYQAALYACGYHAH